VEAFPDGEREGGRITPTSRAIGSADTPPLSGILSSDVAAVNALRRYFERGCGAFSPAEVARLRFVRWLVETGRLDR
jgi:hypothetical protein